MKPMTHELRKQIHTRIKNRLDISDLLIDVDIKGENLSYAVINYLHRINTDVSNCNFAYSKFGKENQTIPALSFINCKMQHCNFEGAQFLSFSWMRSCDARFCTFKHADVSKVNYEYTDFRGSSFCDAIIKISTTAGLGCRFPKDLFEQLTKGWKMQIIVKEEGE